MLNIPGKTGKSPPQGCPHVAHQRGHEIIMKRKIYTLIMIIALDLSKFEMNWGIYLMKIGAEYSMKLQEMNKNE